MIKELQAVECGYVGGGTGTELGALVGRVTLIAALASLKLNIVAPQADFNRGGLSSNGWKVFAPNACRAASAVLGWMAKAFGLSLAAQFVVDSIVG